MRVLLLGATGSIGKQTIDVINKLNYQLVGISFFNNVDLASKINVSYKYSPIHQETSNVKSYDELIKKTKPDLVVNAIVGFAGLQATIDVINNKKTLLLANKESLVVAGKWVMKLAKKHKVDIYPIDSEHASVFQILNDNPTWKFKKIFITASGGPFYNFSKEQLSKVTYNQAISHPNWNMGHKISVDSSTLMNKCFELIEAYWYFNTQNIEALYHPTSMIHAIVEFDNEISLQFVSKPDMHLPIEQALTLFKNKSPNIKPINFAIFNNVYKIPGDRYLPIAWANQCLTNPNSSLPIILNAANEVAIDLFTKGQIKYINILEVIDDCIKHIEIKTVKSIDEVYDIDSTVRKYAMKQWSK